MLIDKRCYDFVGPWMSKSTTVIWHQPLLLNTIGNLSIFFFTPVLYNVFPYFLESTHIYARLYTAM